MVDGRQSFCLLQILQIDDAVRDPNEVDGRDLPSPHQFLMAVVVVIDDGRRCDSAGLLNFRSMPRTLVTRPRSRGSKSSRSLSLPKRADQLRSLRVLVADIIINFSARYR